MTAILIIVAIALLLYAISQLAPTWREWFSIRAANPALSGVPSHTDTVSIQSYAPHAWWPPVIAALIAILGLAAPHLIPTDITLTTHGPTATLSVEGEAHSWSWPAAHAVRLVSLDPATHDWGIDGSQGLDSSASTEDPEALAKLVASPYGTFDQSLYNEGGIDGVAAASLNGHAISAARLTAGVVLPTTATLDLAITHVEAPVHLVVTAGNGSGSTITIDRSGRSVSISSSSDNTTLATWYYPTAALPHLAPVLGQVGQAALWALVLYGLTLLVARLLAASSVMSYVPAGKEMRHALLWNVAAGLCVVGSFLGTLWVTLAEYYGMPHIQDTNAYVMQGRILESGRLFGPESPVPSAFGLPFFGVMNGHWVGQYAPGNGLVIAAGLIFGFPWLGPVCLAAGTVLLISLIARRLYGRPAGAVAALLAALSPFHLFIAGSYLSHVPDAFFLTLSFYLLVRSEWGRYAWLAALGGASIGAALFCRELSALLWGVPLGVALLVVAVQRVRTGSGERGVLRPWLGVGAFVGGGIPFLLLYALYNALATGSATISPRSLINSTDRYGFGPGHGWWATHTLAAGLVNLEQQLTGLNLEALGWPVGATLGAVVLLFIVANTRPIDIVLCLLVACVLASTVGYFYNGVVYGPRYVYEALPPLLILIAGSLSALCGRLRAILVARSRDPRAAVPAVTLVVVLLFIPTVATVLPRHVAFYRGYTALNWAKVLPLQQLYDGAPNGGVVAVSDVWTYSNIVGNMTDPRNLFNTNRTNGTVWAQASAPADYARLRAAFPHRTLYILSLDGSGYHFIRARR